MNSITNYEELYHTMQSRRGDESRQIKHISYQVAALMEAAKNKDNDLSDRLKQLGSYVAGLVHLFESTDRIVANCAETQAEPKDISLDAHIERFLKKLDPQCYLRRCTDTRLVLQVMAQEGEALKTMSNICARAAAEMGCTPSRIERNLRSFREAARKTDTQYYRTNLAEFNKSNSIFYWNALRLLKREMGHLLLVVVESQTC